MALTLNTQIVGVTENVDLTLRKDEINNGKVEVFTAADLLALIVPTPPAVGSFSFYLLTEFYLGKLLAEEAKKFN